MQHVYTFHIKNPPLASLGYVIAIANLDDKRDRSAPSDYYWKILKCRMIIFSSSSILACPEKNEAKRVHIVFNKYGDDYDKLNSLLLKFSLTQNGEIQPTTPEIFKMCFEYTMTAKLAPMWNTVGYSYFINNRDFLTAKGPQDGVSYRVFANEHETTLEIKPVRILFAGKYDDYRPGEMIRVLPSLNKAVIEDCHDNLPDGIFKSYKDLRRHWKNIHGYRLPENEPPYCSIRFWRGEPLTYPIICITRSFPITSPIPRSAEKIVIGKFLTCLKSKMTYIAGIPLTIKNVFESAPTTTPNISMPDTQAVSLCTPTQHR